jgi:hypothetical protein
MPDNGTGLGAAIGAALAAAWRGLWPWPSRHTPTKRTGVTRSDIVHDAFLSIRLPSQLRRRLAAVAARLEQQRRTAGTLDAYFGRFTLSDCCREILAGAVEHYEASLAAQQPLQRERSPDPPPW